MANRRDIKRRIQSVVNTQKITKAMKLVAAAKFSKASQSVASAKPYAKAFSAMVDRVLNTLEAADLENMDSPLLGRKTSDQMNLAGRPKGSKRKLLVLVSTDRGLCGGLNSNLLKQASAWILAQSVGTQVDVFSLGKKGTSWTKKRKALQLVASKEKSLDKPTFLSAKNIVTEILKVYAPENLAVYEEVSIAFSEFKNALTQIPTVKTILPVTLAETGEGMQKSKPAPYFEPSSAELLGPMLRTRLELTLFQALLEHSASEHGSRMTAMDNASTNATEVRKKLTLQYNRARQAAITKELIEIVSGAEAL